MFQIIAVTERLLSYFLQLRSFYEGNILQILAFIESFLSNCMHTLWYVNFSNFAAAKRIISYDIQAFRNSNNSNTRTFKALVANVFDPLWEDDAFLLPGRDYRLPAASAHHETRYCSIQPCELAFLTSVVSWIFASRLPSSASLIRLFPACRF